MPHDPCSSSGRKLPCFSSYDDPAKYALEKRLYDALKPAAGFNAISQSIRAMDLRDGPILQQQPDSHHL
jgi:hypothetical protein